MLELLGKKITARLLVLESNASWHICTLAVFSVLNPNKHRRCKCFCRVAEAKFAFLKQKLTLYSYRKSSNKLPGAYFKFSRRQGAFIWGGRLIEGGRSCNFSQIVAWHDHFFYIIYAHKQQHVYKLFIDIKSWSS